MLLVEMSTEQLSEMTTYQLDRSTRKAYGDTRDAKSHETSIGHIEFSATQEKGKKQLVVKSFVTGPTGRRYAVMIIFKNVKYEEEDTNQNITVQSSDGKQLHIDPYSTGMSDVQVRCDCMDFYWRFANWNFKHHALSGDKPSPYVKVTNRPPVNPLEKAGTCKHLYKLVEQLQAKRLIG